MSGIADLIERLERLEGPSREVDIRIGVYLEPHRFTDVQFYPPVTASLDAAIALVGACLPKAFYGIERTGLYPGMIPGSSDKAFKAEVGDWGSPCRAYADNPALALCLALLRALQSQEKQ